MSSYNELKNIESMSVSLSGNNTTNTSARVVDAFLQSELNHNKKQPWAKLNKPIKNQKLDAYTVKYKSTNPDLNLTDDEIESLQNYLRLSNDNKKFTKVKDINYDKEKEVIVCIPGLEFNKTTRKFIIRGEKRVSTLKSLGQGRSTKVGTRKKTSPKKQGSSNNTGTKTGCNKDSPKSK
jgi:hypothetical protein